MSWRRLITLFAVLAYLAAEMLALAWVSDRIGWAWLIALLAAQFAIGLSIARRAGATALRRLADSAREGSVPSGPVGDSALVALGGTLIALPGLVSDIPGVLLLVPPLRTVARSVVGVAVGRRISAAGYSTTTVTTADGVTVTRLHEGQVIEGEVVDRQEPGEGPPSTGGQVTG